MGAGVKQAAGLAPLRGMEGQRWMDAGLRVTKAEEEVEVVEGEGEEVPVFLDGWTEMQKEGEEEVREGDVEEKMKAREGLRWEVEEAETEVVVVVLKEDQG